MDDKTSIDIIKVSQELRIRPEIYYKILSSFSASLDGKVKDLDEAINTNNTDQARMILHEIKGTASNLRAQDLLSAETALHDAVKNGDNDTIIANFLVQMQKEVHKLQAFVSQTKSS